MASKHSYVVNAKEPSTITHSLVANFTAKDQTNVIVAKSTIFEVYVYNEENGRLELVEKNTVNGRIKYITHFRFPNEDKDLLLVLTDRHRLACLSYDEIEIDNEKKKKIVTRCHREITEAFRQPLDEGQIILVNTTHDPPFILHHLYHEFLRIVFFYRDPHTRLFKFTRSEQEKLKDKSSQKQQVRDDENREEKSYVVEIRLTHETHIFDLKFHPTQPNETNPPVLMLCYDDKEDKRCLKTYEMSWPALPGARGYAEKNKDKREKAYDKKLKEDLMLKEIGTRLLLGEKGCKGDDTFKMFLVEPNGVVLLGERSIKYTNLNQEQATPLYTLKQGSFKCYCPMEITVDEYQRFLFGVHSMGRMLMLKLPKKNPSSAKVEYLHADGIEVSVPDRLHQVIKSKVFVASLFGNSQLIELDNNKLKYEEVQSFDNMGPILDMSVVEIDQQKQVVACSNGYKHGTLRVLKVGIGVNEKAYSHLPPVDGLWSLKACSNGSEFDDTIVISNINLTRCVRIQEEGLVKADIKGFQYDNPTVYCANLDYQHFIQVTANSLLLFQTGNTRNPEKIDLPCEPVTIATNKKGQIVLALGKTLFHCHRECGLVVSHKEKSKWEFEMDKEISCIEISDPVGKKESNRLFVGSWLENTVTVFILPDLNQLSSVKINDFSLPRVLLATSLDESESLLCATGDGGLLYYKFKRDTDTLVLKYQLDSENDPPVGSFVHALHEFKMDNNYYVFACTDRPNLISCPEKCVPLKYQNLNLKEVTHITSLHAQSFQNSMAIITEGQLIFLQINEVTTRLHVDTHPIHETPRRIVHQPSSKTFGLVTSRTQMKVEGQNTKPLRKSISWDKDCNPEALGTEIEVSTFLLLDQNSLNLYGRSPRYRLDENEHVFCMTSCKLNDTDYFVLGTGVMEHPEAEQTAGRIILLIVQDGELRQACEVKNPKHAITAMSGLGSDTYGHRLVTAELGKVSLWRLDDDGLKEEAFYEHTIKPVYLITRGETRILIGDIFNSVTRLEYDKDANEGVKLKEKAHDFPHMHAYTWEAPTDDPNFERGVVRAMRYEMACVVFLEDTIWLVADKSYNFRMMVEKTEERGEETIDNTISPLAGLYHLGELVNVFRHGSLVELPESKSSILFGTPVGSIGVLLDLGGKEYELLRELQTKIDTKIEPKHVLMNLHNNEWRMFSDELQIKFKAKNFVDGDLIESLRETFDADTLNNLANEFDHNDEEDGEYGEFTKLERLMIKADNMKKFH